MAVKGTLGNGLEFFFLEFRGIDCASVHLVFTLTDDSRRDCRPRYSNGRN